MNLAKIAEKYIVMHPSVKDCLKKGMINYSKLARMIAKESDVNIKTDFDALLVACRRYAQKIKRSKISEEKIIDLLKRSKIEIKNKVIAVVIEKDVANERLIKIETLIKDKSDIYHSIEGASAITIITSKDFKDPVKKEFGSKIISINDNLAELIIKSPSEIETTAGVISYLYSLFGEYDINIMETMSCWTDTLFVIQEKDIARIINILNF